MGTTNSELPGPIIMIDQSEILNRSQVQFNTLFFLRCKTVLHLLPATASCMNLVQKNQFPNLNRHILTLYCGGSHTEDGWSCSKYASLAQHNCRVYGAGERRINAVHLEKKSVIKLIWLLISVSDWPITMIGPGGLLLVLPSPICCLSFGVGLKRSK